MSRVGVRNTVLPVVPVAVDAGQRKAFRVVQVIGVNHVSIVWALLSFVEWGREIVPEPSGAFVAEILCLDNRRAIAAQRAIAAKHFGGRTQFVSSARLTDHDLVEL